MMIDPDLIEQMLINLVRNAVDAALEQAQSPQAEAAGPKVTLAWEQHDHYVALMVEDNGIGLLNPEQRLRSVLHNQTGRLRHWPGLMPADRGSARWID